jgi:DNA recombination-dependent growth factor C
MGIVSGGVRLRRYQVIGEVPADFRDAFEESIQRHAFADFEAEDQREQVMGWAAVDDWYDSNLYLDRWLVENTVNLTLRVDTKRIPTHFLNRECRRLEGEWKVKAGRENLTRAERDEIKDIVTRRLLERVIPASQGTDFSWDLNRGDLLFWSTAEKTNEVFRVLFEKTFGLKLRLLFPYTLAQRALGTEAAPAIEGVRPSAFSRGGR